MQYKSHCPCPVHGDAIADCKLGYPVAEIESGNAAGIFMAQRERQSVSVVLRRMVQHRDVRMTGTSRCHPQQNQIGAGIGISKSTTTASA